MQRGWNQAPFVFATTRAAEPKDQATHVGAPCFEIAVLAASTTRFFPDGIEDLFQAVGIVQLLPIYDQDRVSGIDERIAPRVIVIGTLSFMIAAVVFDDQGGSRKHQVGFALQRFAAVSNANATIELGSDYAFASTRFWEGKKQGKLDFRRRIRVVHHPRSSFCKKRFATKRTGRFQKLVQLCKGKAGLGGGETVAGLAVGL